MGTQQFCLKWSNHQANLLNVFGTLLSSEALVDVTLLCEGFKIRAHKMILSACSPFFQDIFVSNPCKHPVIVLQDMKYSELQSILEFMYKGEVNVSHDNLSALLKRAESLQIKGLAEVTSEQQKSNSVNYPPPAEPGALSPVASEVPPQSPVENSHFRRRRRKRKNDITIRKISRQEIEEKFPSEVEEITLPSSPIPEETYNSSLNSNIVQQQSASSNDIPTVVNQSPESETQRILQPHEIKKTPESPQNVVENNPEYVLDPTSFMEQSLTTEQNYVPNLTAKEELPVHSSSSEMMITPHNNNHEDNHHPVYVSEPPIQTSRDSTSPIDNMTGMGLQYDAAENDNSNIMMYMEAGTSSDLQNSSGTILPESDSPPKTGDVRRPKKTPKRPASETQWEYRQRKQAELGEEEFNAREAQRKRQSRTRVWEEMDTVEKERRRVLQRNRAQRMRDRKKAARLSSTAKEDEKEIKTELLEVTDDNLMYWKEEN